jgi:hypothetical protein
VFAVTLNAGAKTATVAPFFADNATATGVNGSSNGKKVTLALTDPDSNGVDSVDDIACATSATGTLYTSDASSGYPANSLGTIDLTTGKVGMVATNGLVTPKGMVFVP